MMEHWRLHAQFLFYIAISWNTVILLEGMLRPQKDVYRAVPWPWAVNQSIVHHVSYNILIDSEVVICLGFSGIFIT